MLKRLPVALLALSIAAGPASAQVQPAAAPRAAALDRAGILILTRQSLTALDQANRTGNYTVLRDLGGPAFHANTAARLSEIFAALRQQNVDLAPALYLDPVLTVGPRVDGGGILRIAGYFPTYPKQLNFEVAYQSVDGAWRLYGLSIASRPPTPTPTAPKPDPR